MFKDKSQLLDLDVTRTKAQVEDGTLLRLVLQPGVATAGQEVHQS